MTQEQIKQAAIQRGCIEGTAEYYGFIEGARSRDWEVERLETELAKAQNPWRDAKTDPPKEGQDVFAYVPNLCGGEYCKLTYLGNYRWSQDEGEWATEFYNNEVRWMPIPKGGES